MLPVKVDLAFFRCLWIVLECGFHTKLYVKVVLGDIVNLVDQYDI